MMKVIVETWDLLWQFAPMDRRLSFSWGTKQHLKYLDQITPHFAKVSLSLLALPSCKAVPCSLAADAL